MFWGCFPLGFGHVRRQAPLEQCRHFLCDGIGMEDEALVRMYEIALKSALSLPDDEREGFIARLDAVRGVRANFDYGVSDDMNALFADHFSCD